MQSGQILGVFSPLRLLRRTRSGLKQQPGDIMPSKRNSQVQRGPVVAASGDVNQRPGSEQLRDELQGVTGADRVVQGDLSGGVNIVKRAGWELREKNYV